MSTRLPVVLLLVVSIALTLSLGEIILRYSLQSPLAHYVETTNRAIALRELKPNQSAAVQPDRRYLAGTDGLDGKRVNLRIDPDGFIEPSSRHDKPDLTLMFLGGSTTESMFVDEPKRFPYLVAVQLEDQYGIKVNAFNGGTAGNNSLHSINKLLNVVAPRKPDMIFLMESINDLNTLVFFGSYWSGATRGHLMYTDTDVGLGYFKYRLKLSASRLIPGYFTLVKRMKDRFIPFEYDEFARYQGNFDASIAKEEELVHSFRANLTLFISISKGLGSTPVLMTQANRIENRDPFVRSQYRAARPNLDFDKWASLYTKFNAAIRTVSREEGVALIDLARLIPPTREYIYDAVHLNDKGSELVASTIVKVLPTILPPRTSTLIQSPMQQRARQ